MTESEGQAGLILLPRCTCVLAGLLWCDLNMPDVAAGCVLLLPSLTAEARLFLGGEAGFGEKREKTWGEQKSDERFMI